MASSDSSLRFRYREVSRVPLLNFPNTRSSYAPPRFHRPSRFDGILSASQRLNCWPRGTLVTRLYERGSFALSLIRSSGETRAHRSPSARPAFLTVRRLLYSNDSFHSFSSAEFCSAYQTPHPPSPAEQVRLPLQWCVYFRAARFFHRTFRAEGGPPGTSAPTTPHRRVTW